MKAEWLRVRVTGGRHRTVDLLYGARAAADLGALLPASVRQMLVQTEADLAGLGERAERSDFEPGWLVRADNGVTRVDIWLE